MKYQSTCSSAPSPPSRRSAPQINGAEYPSSGGPPFAALFSSSTGFSPHHLSSRGGFIPSASDSTRWPTRVLHLIPKTAILPLFPRVNPRTMAPQRDSPPPSDLGSPIQRSLIASPARPLNLPRRVQRPIPTVDLCRSTAYIHSPDSIVQSTFFPVDCSKCSQPLIAIRSTALIAPFSRTSSDAVYPYNAGFPHFSCILQVFKVFSSCSMKI